MQGTISQLWTELFISLVSRWKQWRSAAQSKLVSQYPAYFGRRYVGLSPKDTKTLVYENDVVHIGNERADEGFLMLCLMEQMTLVTICERITSYDSSSVTNDVTSQEKVYCPGYTLGYFPLRRKH